MSIAPTFNAAGETTHYVSTARDVTQEKSFEERIRRLAFYDSLTGLPNRQLFLERLEQAVSRSSHGDRLVAVIVLNLDRFKMINDSFGYEVGDELLKRFATRLEGAVRAGDIVARLGADEFGLALVDLASVEDTALLVEYNLRTLGRKPFKLPNGREAVLTSSIGISVHTPESEDAVRTLENAYVALAAARKLGGNTYKLHQAEMNSRVGEFVVMQRRLSGALANDEFVLHYQPYVNSSDGRLVGMEALIRWQSPGQGLVPPGAFIPVLEETGMILDVGKWVIEEACRQLVEWKKKGFTPVPVAVNLSPIQFSSRDLAQFIRTTTSEAGLDPALITLEITESTFMADIERSTELLGQLKELGHEISIDDFGTGHSSLSYLRLLPVTNLKIDRSFILDILDDDDAASVVRAIVQLASSLGLKTIAEGVETQEHLAALRLLQCDLIQGYHVSRPAPADQIESFLSRT